MSRKKKEVLARETELLRSGKPLESVLADLRAEEFGKIESIKLVREVTGCSLAEAKDLVEASPAWTDGVSHQAVPADRDRLAYEELRKNSGFL
ncbi:ribosomal protein L7/L12 [Amycolatopsis sp. H20-H5]|uniref:ribosomal protein L7/L12 n=1 Tax=Amycolatopsis sp. H20-H5 TaxID=3046309 RepID=UPI002DBFAC77|nr:ribosomal protein L7/L12 [Amycolatopsis sp. H20-H5]MEC3982378.1 ribosomal protein L7/L12 [Amycolatopsis sp. H20-H5]